MMGKVKEGWEKVRFSDFVITNPKISLEKGKEYPFIEMEEISPGNRYVSSTKKRTFKGGGSKFMMGDVLFARITPSLENGKIAQVKDTAIKGFGSTEFFVFRHREGISDSSFIYYLSFSEMIRKPAEKSMFGASGRQRADLNVVQDLEIEVPPLPTQCKIAAILSAYDDLIENNIRRIQILEEMAQTIYKEWFVKFRFPGYEKIKMVDSELGPIPEGWEVMPSSQVLEINPRIKVDKESEKPFVFMENLSNTSMVINRRTKRKGNSGSKFQNGDTLFARITPSLENGKIGFVQFLSSDNEVGLGSTEFIVLRSKHLCPEYVYLLARTVEFRGNAIKSMIGASGRQRVQEACFDHFLLAVPPLSVIEKFHEYIAPIFKNIHLLSLKNSILRRTLDFLLPKLISGGIDVENTAINMAELEE